MNVGEQVTSPKVAESARYYSQAMRSGQHLFIAGQIALDLEGNLVGPGDVVAQARQALSNLQALCKAAGASLSDIVKMTIYLRDVRDATAIRPVRLEFFQGPVYPPLTLIGGIDLADPAWLIEIEATVELTRTD